jgi:hypothetical protein
MFYFYYSCQVSWFGHGTKQLLLPMNRKAKSRAVCVANRDRGLYYTLRIQV